MDESDALMAESDFFSGSTLNGLGMLFINDLGLSCLTNWAGPVRPGNGTTRGSGVVGVATSELSNSPGTSLSIFKRGRLLMLRDSLLFCCGSF